MTRSDIVSPIISKKDNVILAAGNNLAESYISKFPLANEQITQIKAHNIDYRGQIKSIEGLLLALGKYDGRIIDKRFFEKFFSMGKKDWKEN